MRSAAGVMSEFTNLDELVEAPSCDCPLQANSGVTHTHTKTKPKKHRWSINQKNIFGTE